LKKKPQKQDHNIYLNNSLYADMYYYWMIKELRIPKCFALGQGFWIGGNSKIREGTAGFFVFLFF